MKDEYGHQENHCIGVILRADREGVSGDDGWQSETWVIRLTSDEANAWLNARLPRWAENRLVDFQWPPEVQSIQVAFEAGSIRLGGFATKGLSSSSGKLLILKLKLNGEASEKDRSFLIFGPTSTLNDVGIHPDNANPGSITISHPSRAANWELYP